MVRTTASVHSLCTLLMVAAILVASGCRTGSNYLHQTEPRHAGPLAVGANRASADRVTLKVVTFNVEFGRSVDSAIAVLGSTAALDGADVVLLQEMDASGTEKVASALGMAFVYYPAMRSFRTGRDFGNAVLSRWPIVADEKLMLPHAAFLTGTRRTATAVTIRVGDVDVRVYSAHLGTVLEVTPGDRRDQLRTILEDAEAYAHAVVGGDFNSGSVSNIGFDYAFAWPTELGPRTSPLGRWDHILVKGMDLTDATAAGTVQHARGASDHRPVWAVAVLAKDRPR